MWGVDDLRLVLEVGLSMHASLLLALSHRVVTWSQGFSCAGFTHRPLSSCFLWYIFRILQGNPKKELLTGLWVGVKESRHPIPSISGTPKP